MWKLNHLVAKAISEVTLLIWSRPTLCCVPTAAAQTMKLLHGKIKLQYDHQYCARSRQYTRNIRRHYKGDSRSSHMVVDWVQNNTQKSYFEMCCYTDTNNFNFISFLPSSFDFHGIKMEYQSASLSVRHQRRYVSNNEFYVFIEEIVKL